MTKNYLTYSIAVLGVPSPVTESGEAGPRNLLVHCVCGWDRTPLVVSLLRLLLWAEGFIHIGLSPTQILFLTVSYDWILFGFVFVSFSFSSTKTQKLKEKKIKKKDMI
jgi:hypothetical protein